jgi:surface protein
MKKIIYLFLALIIVACSDGDSDGGDNNNTTCEYTLNSLPVTNSINDSVTFNGIISIDGNCEFPITEQGFVYSTTIQPTLNNNQVNVNGTNVTTTINNLELNTTYYVRTFLTNALGEFYGNEISFISNNAVYLADNGVTIKAYDWANVGDTGVVNGVTYTIVDEGMLRDMVSNEEDVATLATSKVTNMRDMFDDTAFNQDISTWDVSNVTDMNEMFRGATAFNQPIGDWDVSNVTFMESMFSFAIAFNQDISNWNVSSVINMNDMFYRSPFNQPIGDWDVSSVIVMQQMFENGTSFNQPIGDWDVSNVTNMSAMFRDASSFNQDISTWSVDGVVTCGGFSDAAPLTEENTPNFTNCTP